jgi:hypothetical protein
LTTEVWCTTTYGAKVPSSDIGRTLRPSVNIHAA